MLTVSASVVLMLGGLVTEYIVMVILLLALMLLPEKLPSVMVLPEVTLVKPVKVDMLSWLGMPIVAGTTTVIVSAVAISTVFMKLSCMVVDLETVVLVDVTDTPWRLALVTPVRVVEQVSIRSPVARRVDMVMLSTGLTVGGSMMVDMVKLKALDRLLALMLVADMTVWVVVW